MENPGGELRVKIGVAPQLFQLSRHPRSRRCSTIQPVRPFASALLVPLPGDDAVHESIPTRPSIEVEQCSHPHT